MSKQETVNTFDGGLVMDLNPMTTPNNVVTDCLNSTMITYDGNEFILQNDMGNGRVETAKLDAGYIPVGIKEYGGIIYVASVNPLTNKCQLGSFPSPERNFTTDEISKSPIILQTSDFFTKGLNTMYVRKELLDGEENKLRPGDKFIIGSTGINDSLNDILSDYKTKGKRILRLHLAILDDDNNISYIEDEVNHVDGYWIYPLSGDEVDDAELLAGQNPKYPYNVYKNKVSGKLLLIAELETPKTFNTSVDVYKVEDDKVSMMVPISWDEDEEEKAKLLGVKVECEHEGEGNLTRFVDFDRDNYEFKIEDLVKDDKLFTYAFTPYTSFGTIDYLSKRGSMNLSYIGTGKIDLVEWRYYVDQNSISISWGLEAYPRYGYQITEVNMDFRDVTDPNTPNVYRTRQRRSYNGNFTEYITFDESNVYFDNSYMHLEKGKLYVVRIEAVSTNSLDSTNKISNITYRLMYTSSTFNESFIANKVDDFSSLEINCDLDIDVNQKVGEKTSSSNTLMAELVKSSAETTPKDMMSFIYTSFEEEQEIVAVPILKKNSDKNFFIGDIGESDVTLEIDVKPQGIDVTDYEPKLMGSTGLEEYYNSILPNVGTGSVTSSSAITRSELLNDDSMKFEITGNATGSTWKGTLKGSNIKKITSDLKYTRESGSVRRIAPYMDLENFRQSDISPLFGHEISTPTAASPHFHFNKMIAMISGRKKKSSSQRYRSGVATYSNGWALTDVTSGKDTHYAGDLPDNSTGFTNDFYACMNNGYAGRPIFAVLRGCGRDEDGNGRLKVLNNYNLSWPYSMDGNLWRQYQEPDYGGWDLDCNRWSFILWKTTDSDKYVALNACMCVDNWDGRGSTFLLDKLMLFLSQLYVAQDREYSTERYIPDNVYYQNNFKAAYRYTITAEPTEKGNKVLNIISEGKRINAKAINDIIADFGDTPSEKVIIADLPSLNNINYILSLDRLISQEYFTSVTTPSADSLLIRYTTAGEGGFSGLGAVGPNGDIYEATLNGEPFSEGKIYWLNRTAGNVGFYGIQEKPFTLYRDTFSVDSSGKITVSRVDTVDVSSGNYSALGNILTLQSTETGKPNILINRASLGVAGATRRISSYSDDDWFNIYQIKISSDLAICG